MIKKAANFIGRHWLQHNNDRTVCPPGRLEPPAGLRASLILVPTAMRSGTHVLIDLILNNFSAYKRRPLYVDFDRLLDLPERDVLIDRLLEYGGYVVKTHYPQPRADHLRETCVRRIAEEALIVTTLRDTAAIERSISRFPELRCLFAPPGEVRASIERFYSYWRGFDRLPLAFETLVSESDASSVVRRVGEYIGQTPNERLIAPFPKRKAARVYWAKALTRVRGCRARAVNTTIGFAR